MTPEQTERLAILNKRFTALQNRWEAVDQSFSNTWIMTSITSILAIESTKDKDDNDNFTVRTLAQGVFALDICYRLYLKYGKLDSKHKVYTDTDPAFLNMNVSYEKYLSDMDGWLSLEEKLIAKKETLADHISLVRPLCFLANTYLTLELKYPVVFFANMTASTISGVNSCLGNPLKFK